MRVTWRIFLALFEFFGLDHLSDGTKLNVVLFMAFSPIVLFIIAIIIDTRALAKEERSSPKKKN